MCARPFTLLKAAFDTAFPLDSIVMFEQDGIPDIAFISGTRKDRYLAVTTANKEVELVKPRIHRLPGSFPADAKSVQDKVKFIAQLLSESSVPFDVKTIWERCSEGTIYREQELCSQNFGEVTLTTYCRTRIALLVDRVYFKRDKAGFIPRSAGTVEQLKREQVNREEKLKLYGETAQFLKAHAKDRTIQEPENLSRPLQILKECAAAADLRQESDFHDAEDIIHLCESVLHIEPSGDLPERAFYILCKAGIFRKDTNLSIIRHRVRLSFPKEVEEEASSLQIPNAASEFGDSSQRVDLTSLFTVTIDDESTKDMDDALSLVQNENGTYTLYVHITDVSCLVKQKSLVDEEAFLRATSIYCPDITVPMLPETLCNEKLSLIAGAVRPTITGMFTVDHSFVITSSTLVPALIRVDKRYSYNEVDHLLDGSEPLLRNLHSIAAIHEAKRLEQGASPVSKRDAQAVLGPGGEIKIVEVDEQSPGRALVGEMMVLINCRIAEFLANRDIPALYRGQEPSDHVAKSGSLEIPDGPAKDYAERGRLKRSIVSTVPSYHATLGVHAYVQCSSPIRRYSDLVIQRQISSVFRDETPPYSRDDLVELSQKLEEPLHRAVAISKETKRYWLLKYLEKYYLHTKRIKGTVIRTDTKLPMVELDEVFIIAGARIQNPKLGMVYTLQVQQVDPRGDYIRLEEYKPRQTRY